MLRAFRTSPIESLQVETSEPSLQTRRLKLSLPCYMKMKANPENPAYSCVVNPEFKRLFRSKPRNITTLGIILQPHLEDMEVECPSWLIQQPNIPFNLSDLRRVDTCPLVFQSMLFEFFRGTGRCILTDQRMTWGQVCPLSMIIMKLAVVSTMRLQSAQHNYQLLKLQLNTSGKVV